MTTDTLEDATVVLVQLELEHKDYWVRAAVQKETKTQLTVLNRKYNKSTGRLVAADRHRSSNAACIRAYDPSKDQFDEYKARIKVLNKRTEVRLSLDNLAKRVAKGGLDSLLDNLQTRLEKWK